MKRAGRRSVLIRREAQRFAAELIAIAREREMEHRPVALGSASLGLGLTRRDEVGALIDGAFLAGTAAEALHLTVASHADVPVLPPTRWATPWIEARQEVPARIAFPYRIFFDRVVGTVFVLDQSGGSGVAWVRHPAELDVRSLLTPFRILLSWFANLRGAELLHASASVVDGRAAIFSGPSGSGKSTLALGLAALGLPIIADDCVLLEQGDVHAVYARAKVDAGAAGRLAIPAESHAAAVSGPRAKQVIAIGDTPEFCPAAPLGLIAVPVTGGRSASAYRLPRRRAFDMVSKDSLRELNGGGTRNRLRIARLIAERDVYRMLLSPSINENRDLIVDLASRAR